MNQSTKTSQCWRGLFSLIALVMACAATSVNADFCYRTPHDRGGGKVPTACADAGRVMEDGLCYKKNMEPGYDCKAAICLIRCPAGWRDDGVFCAKPVAGAPYGVGAGYGWKVGDGPSNYDPAGARCRADNAGVGCSKEALIWYPNCKTGYKKSGLLICSPDPVQCPSGFKDIGVSCAKSDFDRGVGVIPNACGAGQQFEAGLCYADCKPGSVGVGSVCTQKCPASAPVQCVDQPVPGCASSQSECVKSFFEPVSASMAVISNELRLLLRTNGGASHVSAAIASIKRGAPAIKGLSAKEALDLISAQALIAGVTLTREELDNWSNTLVGGTFDPSVIDYNKVNAWLRAYKKPMICQS